MLPLFVEVLQKRASRAEEALELKEKDMASLREQMQQCEARRKESEAKMKSAEEKRQRQITSLQVSLFGFHSVENTALVTSLQVYTAFLIPNHHSFPPLPLLQKDLAAAEIRAVAKSTYPHSYVKMNDSTNPGSNEVKEFEKRKIVTFAHEELTIVDVKPGQSHLIIPIEKLQRLKRMIKSWVKDNKIRLRDSKTKIHSMGHHTEADNHWRAWWGKKSKRSYNQ